jgi:hypothetical protein
VTKLFFLCIFSAVNKRSAFENIDQSQGGNSEEGFKANEKLIIIKGSEKLFYVLLPYITTLCSQVVFHNVPHLSHGQQKSGTKSTS